MVSGITRFYCQPDMTSSWLGGVSHRFCWRNLRKRLQSKIMVHWHISLISHRFKVIWYYILAGNFPFRPILRMFLWQNTNKAHNYTFLIPNTSSSHQTASFELLCAKISSVWAVALLKKKTKQKSHMTHICCPHVVSRPLIGSKPNVAWLVTSLTLSPTPMWYQFI